MSIGVSNVTVSNRQYRKDAKGKAIFPNDKALAKSLFLATKDATEKWTMRIRHWDQIKKFVINFTRTTHKI